MKIATAIWLAIATLIQAAGLEFKEISKVIDAPADVADVTAEYEFTNTSDKPVTIVKSDPGCSCMAIQVSDGKLRYEPGESGTLRAKFEMGNFSGAVDKAIALWLTGDPDEKPSVILKLTVNIPVLVALEPKTLKWELGGKGGPQTIDIRMAEGQTIRVTDVKSSSSAFIFKTETVEEGKHYQLIVTPVDMASPGIGVIRIDTDCAIAKHKTQQAFAVVRKPTPGEAAARP